MFTPSDIEDHTGWTTNGLRDLRGKNILSGYGERQESGRWTFSDKDLVAFSIASILHFRAREKHEGLPDLRGIFSDSLLLAGPVLSAIRGEYYPHLVTKGYSVSRVSFESLSLNDRPIKHPNTYALIDDGESFETHVFDVPRLAKIIPQSVKKVVKKP